MARFTRLQVLNQLTEQGLVPLFYHPDLDVMKKSITAAYDGGARLFEFTNRGDLAYQLFADLVRYTQKELPNLIVGTGSVLDPGTAALYLSSGANFIVGSIFNPDVAKLCNRRKTAYIPGCGTTNEISTAEEYGAEFVKIFPGEAVGGPGFIKAILGPTPWTRIMVTGGVEDNPQNISSWIKAGATAVGMGSNLFKPNWINAGQFDEISNVVANVLKWIRRARGLKTEYHLDHIGIYPTVTANGAEIARWYSETFELQVKDGNSSYFLEGSEPGRLEIMKEPTTNGVHIAIAVSNYEDAINELHDKGIEVEDNPNIKTMTKSVFLKQTDPAGNPVHILWRKSL